MPLEPSWYIMENLSNSRKKYVLPEFQAFLLDKKLAKVNTARSISGKRRHRVYRNYEIRRNVSDWQIRQAGDTIRLCYFHYRGFKPNN